MLTAGQIFRVLNRWLGWVLVITILTIALLTVAVRQLLPAVWDYKAEIEQYLSGRLHTEVTIGEIHASWEGRFPRLLLQDVVLADHRSHNIGRVELGQLILGLNPVSSLLKWQPVLSQVEIWSLHTQVKLVRWPRPGSDLPEAKSGVSSSADPLAVLLLQPHIFFYDTQIDLTLPTGKQLLLQSERLNLENSTDQHHFAGELLVTHEQRQATAVLRIESDNYQLEPKNSNVDFYLKLNGIDTPLLDAARELFPVPESLEQLELDAEIWGNWSDGRLTRLYGGVAGGALQLTTGKESMPQLSINELASGFALLQPRRRHFQLQIEDFSARINNQPLALPQLVVNRREGRIDSAELSELNVTALTEFLINQPSVPENFHDVLVKVAPTGVMRNLSLRWPETQETHDVSGTEKVVIAEAITPQNGDSEEEAPESSEIQKAVSDAENLVAGADQESREEMVVVNDAEGFQQDWQHLTVLGDLDAVAFKAAYGAPAMSGVTGLLQLDHSSTGLKGRIDLVSEKLGLHFPDVFDQGWEFSKARGTTHVSLADNILHLSSDYVTLHKTGINASGRWSLYLPLTRDIQSELTLLIGVKDSDGHLAPELIPDHEIDPGIKQWVAQSIKEGTLNQGGFMLHTGTRSIPSRQPPTVQMFMDIADAVVDYQPGWPEVSQADASLLLRDQGLAISVSKGQIQQSSIEHGWVYLPPRSHNLNVIAAINGDSSDIGKTLLESPVIGGDNKELQNWRLSGAAETRLKLSIPLQDSEPDVDVTTRFSDLKLASEKRNLSISKLAGEIGYRSESGLSASSLRGEFFGQPLSASIRTTGKGQSEKITARLKSSISMVQLKKWTGIEMLALAEGKQPYEADLDICIRSDCSGLTVRSDLMQTKLDLIPPYNKLAGQSRAFLLNTDFASPQTFNIKAGDNLSAWLQLEGDQFSRGSLVLGTGDARPTAYNGLEIGGRLGRLDYDQLNKMLQRASIFGDLTENANSTKQVSGSESKSDAFPVLVDVGVDLLSYSDLLMEGARVSLKRLSEGWAVGVVGTDLDMQVSVPDSPAVPPFLLFKRLDLDAVLAEENTADNGSSNGVSTKKPPGVLQPGSVPDLDIEIRDLIVQEKRWGLWRFDVRNRDGNTYIENIAGELSALQASGDIVWRPGVVSQSEMNLKVEATDLGRALESAGFKRVLETDKLNASLSLQWPGAPWEYELADASGALKFDAREGRLIEAGSGTGILRVFGILNMNALGRRLKLDFADLFAKGVSFDRMEGDYRIVGGLASTNEPFVMRGPSVDMAMIGDIDLVSETVNQQMAVTLPVTDNLPLAAVLLGAPQVAGLAFLLDKLIGDEVKKELATVTYKMEGDWSDPVVEVLQKGTQEKAKTDIK